MKLKELQKAQKQAELNQKLKNNTHMKNCNCICNKHDVLPQNNHINNNHTSINVNNAHSEQNCIIKTPPQNASTCSLCNRKIVYNKNNSKSNVSTNMNGGELIITHDHVNDSNDNLRDSNVFYSSIGVANSQEDNFAILNQSNLNNNHEFYCYSANDANFEDNQLKDDELEAENILLEHQPKRSRSNSKHVNRFNSHNLNNRKRHNLQRQTSKTPQICCFLCCCCCARRLDSTWCCIFLERTRLKFKAFIEGSFFQRTILCAILINTISMGVEHHQQVIILNLK
jgi:hypothetical protein